MGEQTTATAAQYDERLGVPLWWWPFAALIVALLGAEIHVGLPLVWKVVTYAVLGALVASWLINAGRTHVRVRDGELIAGDAHVPVALLGEVRAVDPETTRRILGPHSDPAAHVATRPWVKTAVYVELRDPADPTPYWLVGSRHADDLAEAIERARAGVRP